MKFVIRGLRIIDRINTWVGGCVAFLAIFMMLSVVYEVAMRYFFNNPTIWSMEVNQQLLCAYTALAGGYILLHGAHVNVDIVYEHFSPRRQALVDIVTSGLAFWFLYVLLTTSFESAMEAFIHKERSITLFEPYLFPVMATIPIGAALFTLQLVARLIRDFEKLMTGKIEILASTSVGDL